MLALTALAKATAAVRNIAPKVPMLNWTQTASINYQALTMTGTFSMLNKQHPSPDERGTCLRFCDSNSRLDISKYGFHTLVSIAGTTNVSREHGPVQSCLQVQTRTFKMKHILRLRCRGCYIVEKQGTRYVLCNTHPRHKQKQIRAPAKTRWILTHATQGRRKY